MKRLLTAALGLTVLFSTSAWGFDPDIKGIENMTVVDRFPAGSIVTREKAQQALSEVKSAKRQMNDLADYSTRRCQENFFVNRCVEEVRKAKLRQERRFTAIETEAKQYIRQDDTKREAQRQKERDAKAAKTPSKPKAAKPRVKSESQAESAKKTQAYGQKRAEQVKKRQDEAKKKQAQEAANRAAYEKKLKEREARRLEREKKLAERQKKKAEQQKNNK
ncbi:MAG: hypothetical protein Q4E62_03230 [Sutterellaceae bacterium]|nr:hypothetical protein [Sutterellaceae bacterium]